MNKELKGTMDMVRAVARNAKIKVHRGYADFLADRLVIAGTESNLLKCMERLVKLLDTEIEAVGDNIFSAFIQSLANKEIEKVLSFLRTYPKITAMIATIRDDKEYQETLETIKLDDIIATGGQALQSRGYDIPMTITCLSPLSHGSDTKAGNATLFRRMQVLSTTGQVLNLPFYAGNAIRGQIRDLLADHFLLFLGLTPRRAEPLVALWFFHALYAGGALEEDSAQAKALGKKVGTNGVVKAEGIHEIRNMLPALSLLGVALGNKIISGRINTGDAKPQCIEWGTGTLPVASLFEWTYLTRREDNEEHNAGENVSMIVNVECLRAGTVLQGGIDLSGHITEIEKSCLDMGLLLLQQRGYLGAEGRRGLGQVKIETERPFDGNLYQTYLQDNKEKILIYLKEIGGIWDYAPCKSDSKSVTKTE